VTLKTGTWLSESIDVDTSGIYPRVIVRALVNGDVNRDDAIDIGDLSALSAAIFTEVGDSEYSRYADLDGNGSVDIGDFAILSQNFGEHR
jgi:hypothetical protein